LKKQGKIKIFAYFPVVRKILVSAERLAGAGIWTAEPLGKRLKAAVLKDLTKKT
jgi:hypothetical protein